jgi:hypothetical protein
MTVNRWPLDRFERILFRAALVLGGLLIFVRLGAMVVLAILHHSR